MHAVENLRSPIFGRKRTPGWVTPLTSTAAAISAADEKARERLRTCKIRLRRLIVCRACVLSYTLRSKQAGRARSFTRELDSRFRRSRSRSGAFENNARVFIRIYGIIRAYVHEREDTFGSKLRSCLIARTRAHNATLTCVRYR